MGNTRPVRASGEISSAEDVIALLRSRGGRATAARRALLELLFESGPSLTAEQIAAAMQERAPDVHISTVYRNLEDLEELGVIVHSHLGHGPAEYQLAAVAHAHLLCEKCGAAFDAPDDFFRNLSSMARDKFGFVIDPRHFAILGRCADCFGS